jgi:hypothetical protein
MNILKSLAVRAANIAFLLVAGMGCVFLNAVTKLTGFQPCLCIITGDASLRLDKVLDLILVQFKRRLAPITMFSHVFQAAEVPRDKSLLVPYVPLDESDSQDWDPDTGYSEGDFNIEKIPVPLTKRKYQALSFSWTDLLGLPAETLAASMVQKADKLAADVTADILSVVTNDNYGAAIADSTADAWDTDSIADVGTKLSQANWPTVGRFMVLDSTFCGNLRKDPALKFAYASGSTTTLREGLIGNVSGFDTAEVPNFPSNGENLRGITATPFGILVANCPVSPTEEVKTLLSDYRVVTDPQTGLTLTYRAWGSPDFDLAKRIIEFSYGYAKGDPLQLKRITDSSDE